MRVPQCTWHALSTRGCALALAAHYRGGTVFAGRVGPEVLPNITTASGRLNMMRNYAVIARFSNFFPDVKARDRWVFAERGE